MNSAMKAAARLVLVLVTLLLTVIAPVHADGKGKLAREAADYVLQRFGRQAAKEGAETLARKIESYAARHGDEFVQAIRRAAGVSFG